MYNSRMIKKEDIQNLAGLARIDISEDEADSLTSEIDSILDYVSQVQNISSDLTTDNLVLKNVMRDDVVTNTEGEFTETLLSLAPQREGKYLKVKKIL